MYDEQKLEEGLFCVKSIFIFIFDDWYKDVDFCCSEIFFCLRFLASWSPLVQWAIWDIVFMFCLSASALSVNLLHCCCLLWNYGIKLNKTWLKCSLFWYSTKFILFVMIRNPDGLGRRGCRDRMVVGFTTTYAISAYHL